MSQGPMPVGPDSPVATACSWALAAAGAVVLAAQHWRARGPPPPPGVPPWRARGLDFACWLWCVLAAQLAGNELGAALTARAGPDAASDFTAQLIRAACFEGALLAALVLLWRGGRSCSPAPLNRTALPAGRILGQGALAWLGACALLLPTVLVWDGLLQYIQNYFPVVQITVQEAVSRFEETGHPWARAAYAFLFVVVAPLNEEWLFRAGIYRFLKGRTTPLAALVATNLLFALAHANALAFLPLFLLGLLLTRAYERSGNVAVPVVFHALFNLNSIAFMLLFPEVAQKALPN